MTLYRIRDWAKHFENSRTETIKSLNWVPIPNRLDGAGFTELADNPEGAAHYGVWVTLVLIASRCHDVAIDGNEDAPGLQRTGTLLKSSGRPHDSKSIARITGFSDKLIERAMERLIAIRWLEKVSEAVAIDGNGMAINGNGIAAFQNGMEGNGMEGNRNTGAAAVASSRFVKPTLEQVAAFIQEIRNGVDAQEWFDHYESNGWKVGRNPMKDWKACVRKWGRSRIGKQRPAETSQEKINRLRAEQRGVKNA